jgi:hypothetical protein
MLPPHMQKLCLPILVISMALGITSCVEGPEKKPIGPVSDTSKIPWNTPVAGQGQGQFGMLPQNQYRR